MTTPPPLPVNQNAPLASYLQRLQLWLTASFKSCVRSDQGVSGLILVSSGGKVWEVTVTDAGALHTTQMTPGQPP